MGEGGEQSRQGGWPSTAVSHQHSVNCSQPVAASQGHGGRVRLGAVQGPKIPPIRRSSQFVWPYPCSPPLHASLPGRLGPSRSGVMCKSVAKSSLFPPPSGSDYAFSSLFSIFSLWLCYVLQLASACVGFSSLGLLPSPPFDL